MLERFKKIRNAFFMFFQTDIKINYIIPTLEYFTQGTNDERESYVSESSSLMYGIVVYKTAQSMPGVSCVTYGPFLSPQKVLNVIDKLEYVSDETIVFASMKTHICFTSSD